MGEEPYRKVVIAPKNPRPYKKSGYGGASYGKRSSYGGYKSYEKTDYTPSYTADGEYDGDGEE